MGEPTLSEVHADLVDRLKHDERLRNVEIEIGSLRLLPAEIRRMEDRLIVAIVESRPKSPWPAVSALAAVLAVFLVAAAAIYSR